MKIMLQRKKAIAIFMLLVYLSNLCMPVAAYALTSGPTQPEMKGFEPAGTAGLVDAFSGDFTYNLPLMDVGGYPLNIAYHSGSGMEDEASWVGFGWSLNPGVVDRQLRGLPDDFRGDDADADKIGKTFHMRNDITAGIDLSFQPEIFGLNTGLVNLGLQAGIFYNNKRGIGVAFGLDANAPLLSVSQVNGGTNTAGLSAGAGLQLNSQAGASFSPSVNFSITGKTINQNEKNTAGIGLGASFQSRAGLQYATLGAAFNRVKDEDGHEKKLFRDLHLSYTSFAGQTFLPETQADYFNESFSLTPQLGGELWGFYPAAQLTGHYSLQKVANPVSSYNAYGFMHSYEGKDDTHGLMDFNREKDVPYFDNVPNLPVPVATPDLFTAHAQDGSAQYRAFSGGTGIFSDHESSNTAVTGMASLEIGGGTGFKIGGDVQASLSETVTGKWKSGNRFLYADENRYDTYGNFTGSGDSSQPDFEPVYFKRTGELVPANGSIYDSIGAQVPVRVKTTGRIAGAAAENILTAKDNREKNVNTPIRRSRRDTRNNSFSYLTADQVKTAGLDKHLIDYYQLARGFTPVLNSCDSSLPELAQPYKKDHHIAEITITDDNGGRKIYGLPAYNTYQEDVSFSVDARRPDNLVESARGLVNYSAADASQNNKKGTDYYYSKEIIPGYAHSFLLTGILSPDYTDLTGNGISDDDPGTAIKFNYWRKTSQFQWRTPYAEGQANYNQGLKSDENDDRANYSYGKKELWYLHSIESKTMVAVFETGNREDALGADARGIPVTDLVTKANRQQYLKTIKLYAKADWYANGTSSIPLKTVHFVYDYSLFSDSVNNSHVIPNNTGQPRAIEDQENILQNQGGKLTLKKIFFTYQGNTKGILQPYRFEYNFNKAYGWKMYDRWGNYKDAAVSNPPGVNNDDYSYSTQDKTIADTDAALWQLTKVYTPAGGILTVQYESDDYMYVQNRKAMQMYPMAGAGNAVYDSTGYYDADKVYVQLPESLSSTEELINKYFDGGNNAYSRNLFFKALVKLTAGEDKYDYVSGYLDIDNIQTDVKLAAGHNDMAEIKVKKIAGEGVLHSQYHPIAKAAWQFMRLHTPWLLYPGYNVSEEAAPLQFVKALVGAITSITELLAPFDERAVLKKLAPAINLHKSWVRLDAANRGGKQMAGAAYYGKLGGGSRVKEVLMSDEWNSLSASAANTAVYGLEYDYTTEMSLADGQTVIASSGVASYEPMIGNEENPFHQPDKYQQNNILAPDNAYFIDEPLCESYFPGAAVGYSKITVRNKGADGQVGANGYTVSEFYTEKDYPTIVDHTPIDVQSFGGISILQLLNIRKNNSRVLSQGYTIVLNDMQGKPKSEKVVAKGGYEISGVDYYYKNLDDQAPEKELNNEAMVMQEDGTVKSAVIGRDVEMYTDMRSQTNFTGGLNILLNTDAIYLVFAVIPVPDILPLPNASYTGFRSASTVKIIQQYGIPDRVTRRQNGSQVTTQNLAWDAGTGELLLTSTPNEFDDPVYSFHYPAHWRYDKGMGPASKNLGLALNNFSASNGNIAKHPGLPWLVPGDELLMKDNTGKSKKYWINNVGSSATPQQVLIDADGQPVSASGNAVLVRSGRRNMQGLSVGELQSLENPVRNGKLDPGVFSKILNAGASVYNDEWAVAASNQLRMVRECPEGYSTLDSNTCFKTISVPVAPAYRYNTVAARVKNSGYSTCGTLISQNYAQWNSVGANDPLVQLLRTNPQLWKNPGGNSCGSKGQTGDYDGPLNRSAIWPADHTIHNNYTNSGEWIGIRSGFYLGSNDVTSKTGNTGHLFIGFGADNLVEVYIDDVLVAARKQFSDNTTASPFSTWRVKPIDLELNRQHRILIRAQNFSNNNLPSDGAMGVELYNNTYADFSDKNTAACLTETCLSCNECTSCRTGPALINTCVSPQVHIIWSTKCLAGKRFNYHADNTGLLADFNPVNCDAMADDGCTLQCQSTQTVYKPKITRLYCDNPVNKAINPYMNGMRGNWRLQRTFVYHADRAAVIPYIKPGDPDIIEKTDIRKSGAYAAFSPFWTFNGNEWVSQEQQSVKDIGWVKTREKTVFNQKGFEIENADVLNRLSAAGFGYLQSQVIALASNAGYAEIGFDGFEDYALTAGNCPATDSCNIDGHFDWHAAVSNSPSGCRPDTSYAHTGKNALMVTAGTNASLVKLLAPFSSGPLYRFSGNTMLLADNGRLTGFKPMQGKKYLLSAWIHDDGQVRLLPTETGKAGVDITTGGQIFYTRSAGPRVEGWRKVEVVFTIPAAATDIRIQLFPGGSTAWFDDIRIHPFDAQMKTYVYDNNSMRLWAELDENNFATFYEYDDEGILIRVKKETERGIMTLKESRASYRMQTP